MALYDRLCRSCGKSFKGGPRAWYCPQCRQKRKQKAEKEHKERKRVGNARKLGEKYPCDICGKMYTLTSGLQRYCDECAKEHLQQVDNAQSIAWNNSHPQGVSSFKQNEKEKIAEAKTNVEEEHFCPANLKRARESKGLSAYRLSIMAGLDTKTVARLESLKNLDGVSLSTIAKLAFALQMTTAELINLIRE